MELKDNAQLQHLINCAPIGICIIDANTFVAEMLNQKFLDIAGRTETAIIGKYYWDAFPEVKEIYQPHLEQVAKTHKPYHADQVEVKLNRYGKAEDIFVTFVYAPVLNEEGKATKIAIWVLENTRQVNERKEVDLSNQLLEKERYKLYEFFMQAPAGICLWTGPDLTYEMINPAYQKILSGRKLIGRPILEAVPELKGAPLIDSMLDTYYNGTPFEVHELHVPIADYEGGPTTDRYFTFNYVPRRNLDNKIDGVFNFVFEVTEQVVARKKIEESEAHFRHLADLVPAKISNALPSGEVTFFNQQWLDFSGLDFDDLKNFGYHQMIHPEDVPPFSEGLAKAAASGTPFVSEMRFKNTEGDYIWHLNVASPILNENGEITMWVGSTTDIQKLKEEDQRKADFVSLLSHELKTPVTSIKGHIQLMQREIKKTEFQKERIANGLDRINRLVLQLTSLVSDMLDLTRIETGRLDLHKENVNLNELINEVAGDFKLTNPDREFILNHNAEVTAELDHDKIAQVLINLISNAIKYSPAKSPVQISISKENEQLQVSITDKGIGISEKDHQKIFERFYRVEGKDEKQFSGFGIGLYLAYSIIERHGGKLSLKSELQKGATFTFSIPLEA
ncbi:PAS domain-containing protein [Pedobacter paludis]|uniref:histidine kinase n=1 Tax=Pedobacter paludis TaxID=2203212 RepID=A0A317F3X4_9SPHI|nr:PAS domain-containing protein [Pedobacter paludis]PWS33870.1 hypothetical protein DF947_04475 [Pedobacter paludis]